MLDFKDVCSHFRVETQTDDSAQCYCPVHNGGQEKKASLSLTRGEDGRTLLYCHVCGGGPLATEAILTASGLKWSDVLPSSMKKSQTLKSFAEWEGSKGEYKGARFTDSYDYEDEKGYCYTRVRVSLPDNKKTFRYCKAKNGLVTAYKVDRKQYIAFYPFKEIRMAKEDDQRILIVEGEKDAKNAVADGFHAITAGSANDWKAEHAASFEGLNPIIVPDNDSAGFEAAYRISSDLLGKSIPAKVIRWPALFINKGDYSDYVESFEDRQDGIASFQGLIDAAIPADEFVEQYKSVLAEKNQKKLDSIKKVTVSEVESVAAKIRDLEHGKTFEVTDLKCGELIGKLFDKCRYNTTAKQWYFYDGCRWTEDPEGMYIEQAAAVFADALYYYSLFYMDSDIGQKELSDFRVSCGSLSRRSRRTAAIQDARTQRFFTTDQLDSDPDLFNCKNGILNLRTKEFFQHDAKYLLSKVAGVEYKPEANESDFQDFVSQVLQEDHDRIHFLQKYCGYMLNGKPREECFVILYGPTTRNGKGTFCETVRSLFGDYAASISPESLAMKTIKGGGSGASDDIARLAGVRYVNCSEPEKGMKINEALVKTLTGGDSITARHLYQNGFEFKPMFALLMNVNYLPVVTDMTLFTSGRVIVIPFEKHFEESEQDKELKERLREPEKLSSAFNWMLEGLRLYRQEGLKRSLPDSIKHSTEQYRQDSDKLQRFLDDLLIRDPKGVVAAGDVYNAYSAWCQSSGYYTEGKQSFMTLLRTRNLLKASGTINGKSVRNVVAGYRMVSEQFKKYIEYLSDGGQFSWREYLSSLDWNPQSMYFRFKGWALDSGYRKDLLPLPDFIDHVLNESGAYLDKNNGVVRFALPSAISSFSVTNKEMPREWKQDELFSQPE